MSTLVEINPSISIANTILGVKIEWETYESSDRFFRFVLIRNSLNHPRSIIDGIEIYNGTENSFTDSDVKNGETYYYTLFYAVGYAQKTKATNYLTNKNCQFSITALLEKDNGALIYSNLPGLYRRYDSEIDDDPEFNKPLYRICRLCGYELDKDKTFIDKMYDVIDIDKCPPTMLPTLMKFLGVDYDWNLSVKENRLLTKITISAYKKKGTKPGLRLVLTNLLQSKIEIEVPRVRVKRTASKEAIAEKRTIIIRANNFQSNFAWVEENYSKFLETIQEFVPKKLNVKLIFISNFLDEYVTTNMADSFKTYVNDTASFVDTPRQTPITDSLVGTSVTMAKNDEPYNSKGITENVVYRFTEGRRRVDICTAKAIDTVGSIEYRTNSEDAYSVGPTDVSVTHVEVADSDVKETSNTDSFTKSDKYADYIGNSLKENGYTDEIKEGGTSNE